MTRPTIAIALCALVAAAGAAKAQTSLFDQPAAGQAQPLSPAQSAAPAKPKAKPKPRGPVPARSLVVQNDSTGTITSLEVAGDGKTAQIAAPIGPKQKAVLKLPAMKSCLVTVATTFEGVAEPDQTSQDICKDKSIRFME